jgi:hypothetical protein
MTTKTSTASRWLMAREAVCVTVGASQAVHRTHVVRDRHDGMLKEVALTEYPPIREADEGTAFVFRKHEKSSTSILPSSLRPAASFRTRSSRTRPAHAPARPQERCCRARGDRLDLLPGAGVASKTNKPALTPSQSDFSLSHDKNS